MRRLMLLMAAVALSATIACAAFGQAGARNGQRRGAGRAAGAGMRAMSVAAVPAEALKGELKLTDSQVAQIKAIQEKLREDGRALRPQRGAAPDPAAREKMRELTLKARTDIEAILTPEQKAKLTVLLRYFGLLRAAGIPPRALPEVKLTPEQRSQIEALVKAAIEQLQPLKAEERRAKLREIIPDLRSKVSAVLTPEQKKAIAKYQRGGGARRNRQGGAAGAPA